MRDEFEFVAGLQANPREAQPNVFEPTELKSEREDGDVPAQCKQGSCWVETISNC